MVTKRLNCQCLEHARRPSGLGHIIFGILETVAEATHTDEVAWFCRTIFKLPAKVHDVVIDYAICDRYPVAPDQFDQSIAAEKPAARLDERREHFEFKGGQIDRRFSATSAAPVEIDFYRSEAIPLQPLT